MIGRTSSPAESPRCIRRGGRPRTYWNAADIMRLRPVLYMAALNDPDLFTSATPMRTRMRLLRSDPYVNALQVKYGYAVTCHKAQGGQWKNVFVDMGYIPADAYRTLDFYRWLYTAVTRATERLAFVNPSADISDVETI